MTIAELHDQLVAAGIPVVTVRLSGGNATVVYAPAATAVQRAQGDQIAAEADLRPRQPRPLSLVADELQTWIAAAETGTEALRRVGLVAVAGGAAGVIASPNLANGLGIPVAGDE